MRSALAEQRAKPCKRGHGLELSYRRDYWRCRACDREWNAAADARAKAAPKDAPSEVREVPCKHGHAVELSRWSGNRWLCKGCQRQWANRWAAGNLDKVTANRTVQDAKRQARRKAAAPTPEEKALRRLAKGSTTNPDTGCRDWNGKLERGYGRIGCGAIPHTSGPPRQWYTHRLAWTLLRGPIPDGLVVDHLCRNRRCINPDHMRPTTIEGNAKNKPNPPPGRLGASCGSDMPESRGLS